MLKEVPFDIRYHKEIDSGEVFVRCNGMPVEILKWDLRTADGDCILGLVFNGVDDMVLRWNKKGECLYDEGKNLQMFAEKPSCRFIPNEWLISVWNSRTPDVCVVTEVTDDLCKNKRYNETKVNNNSIEFMNTNYRLWNLYDAKDGDILCTYEAGEPKIVFIMKGEPKKHYALSYYCYYNIMYPHFDNGEKPGCLAPDDSDVKPATKEQRDLLMEKMNEAEYMWDEDKKELIKV